MRYKKNLLRIIIYSLPLFLSLASYGQSEKEEVIKTIEQLFEGMRQGDSTMVRAAMAPQARLLTIIEKDGIVSLQEVSLEKFIQAVGIPHDEIWDEKITAYDIKIDDRLASAWTPYQFYLGKNFSHCGVNAMQLYKSQDGWKIMEIADTRRKTNCL
ncbi:nuclear transport factor 2 family protein [Catalinimonas niigatensis]|uniref:nuclear transport factor 2 family protein n=1 Tax=Catalinimonas niigatensis TaxID=1397264 RepID=UPI002664FFE1|nr:nuclear transport factor 2 family protein [Catalinimonas niigatensis]WPP50859.1 nuclear transport factor 2 family protein [Catalinimonas niigatensis]